MTRPSADAILSSPDCALSHTLQLCWRLSWMVQSQVRIVGDRRLIGAVTTRGCVWFTIGQCVQLAATKSVCLTVTSDVVHSASGNNRDAASRSRVWHELRAVLWTTFDNHQRYGTTTCLRVDPLRHVQVSLTTTLCLIKNFPPLNSL